MGPLSCCEGRTGITGRREERTDITGRRGEDSDNREEKGGEGVEWR